MTNLIPKLGRLKKRSEFLFVAKGVYAARGCIVVQTRANPAGNAGVKYGVVASKTVGNSVVRSRAKRRLREAARALLPKFGRPGHDYVFIARASLPEATFERLLRDTEKALVKLAS